MLPVTSDPTTGYGSLVRSADGAGYLSFACTSPSGEQQVATINLAGDLVISPLCSSPEGEGCMASVQAGPDGSLSASLTSVAAGVPDALRPVLSDARSVTLLANGQAIFATPEGVFAALTDGLVVSVTQGAFNTTRSLQPALVHASSSGEVFVVGRPTRDWVDDGHVCAGGKTGVYRFSPQHRPGEIGAPTSWACTGRYTHRAKMIFASGRSMTGSAVEGSYAMYWSADGEIMHCIIRSFAINDSAMTCHKLADASSISGARFAFRGVALPFGDVVTETSL